MMRYSSDHPAMWSRCPACQRLAHWGERAMGLIDWQRCVDRIQQRARTALSTAPIPMGEETELEEVTEAMIEAGAKAFYEFTALQIDKAGSPWESLSQVSKDMALDATRAAAAAMRSAAQRGDGG